jgi:class 3 adenylate cyclase
MDLKMQYALTSDGVRIAFAAAGRGPTVVRMPGPPLCNAHADYRDNPFYDRLCENLTIVTFDPRGTGLSDRDVADVSLAARLRDLDAVVEKLQLEQFALHGIQLAGPLAVTYAVGHPERVTRLILDDSFARAADYAATVRNRAFLQLTEDWDAFVDNLSWAVRRGDRAENERYAEYLRSCVEPEMGRRYYAALRSDDVTDLLPRVTIPTLVLQHEDVPHVALARDLVARLPNASLVLLPATRDDGPQVAIEIERFLGVEASRSPAARPEPHDHDHDHAAGAFRAILFTDVVGHTEIMHRLGDAAGRVILREHERLTREVLRRHGGVEVKTTGDGFMASFSSVAGAVECAIQLQRAFDAHDWGSVVPPAAIPAAAALGMGLGLNVAIRVGLNAGEPIAEEGDYFGATVILASRIAGQAEGGEILASNVVRELCAGKGFLFADRGEIVLRGFEDATRIYEILWRQ